MLEVGDCLSALLLARHGRGARGSMSCSSAPDKKSGREEECAEVESERTVVGSSNADVALVARCRAAEYLWFLPVTACVRALRRRTKFIV